MSPLGASLVRSAGLAGSAVLAGSNDSAGLAAQFGLAGLADCVGLTFAFDLIGSAPKIIRRKKLPTVEIEAFGFRFRGLRFRVRV